MKLVVPLLQDIFSSAKKFCEDHADIMGVVVAITFVSSILLTVSPGQEKATEAAKSWAEGLHIPLATANCSWNGECILTTRESKVPFKARCGRMPPCELE